MTDSFKVGDIVKHFKYELNTPQEKLQNKYLYQIEGFAKDCDNSDTEYVVYRALYAPFQLWIRKYLEFTAPVDTDKYPDIKQSKRYELVNMNRYLSREDQMAELNRTLAELPLTRSSRKLDQKVIDQAFHKVGRPDVDALPFG